MSEEQVILLDSGKGSLIFESINGTRVDFYTKGGVEKIERDETGNLMFTVKLLGNKVAGISHGKVYKRELDGTITEILVPYADNQEIEECGCITVPQGPNDDGSVKYLIVQTCGDHNHWYRDIYKWVRITL